MSTAIDSVDESSEELVSLATDEFLEQFDRDGAADVEGFVQRYPRVADSLRGILPALLSLRGAQTTRLAEANPAGDALSEHCLGDYRILREIGRGGMGVVYEAEQISLRRRVALKVLPFALAMDQRRLHRFQNEAQAAARLHHQNIVPIYAVGSDRGICYYAMQMIDGASLADVVRELPGRVSHAATKSGDASPPADFGSDVLDDLLAGLNDQSSLLTPKETATDETATTVVAALSTVTGNSGIEYYRTVARLGEQAADALQHAHDMDIVHRDIKPANLLVDVVGNLWITDFGLARQLNDGDLTMTGDVLGTYRYMSPEQTLGRRGVVDHRTDVYSLGTTLYELLAHRPAFDAEDRQEVLQHVASREPVPPRRLNRMVPADLEVIVLKSMEKDPKDRYATAREMADDLRRFLDDRPIQAKRPSLPERMGKWSRRHRALVATTLAVLCMTVVGLSVSNILIARERSKTRAAYLQITQKQQATVWALAEEAKQRELAEANFQQARDMLDFMVQASIDDLETTETPEDLRSRLLQASLEYYQGFIEQSDDNPPLQTQLASSHARVAKILDLIGSTPEARAALERALETQERLVQEHPTDFVLRQGLFKMYYQLRILKGGFPLMLADQPEVQQELALLPEQIEGVNKIQEEHSQMHREFAMSRSVDLPQMREEFRQSIDRSQTALAGLLTEEQLTRLEQIALQRRGVWALDDPTVATRIGLTATQRSLIWKTLQEARRRRWSRPEPSQPSLDEQVAALLTPEQESSWQQMLGEPFEYAPSRRSNRPPPFLGRGHDDDRPGKKPRGFARPSPKSAEQRSQD